jgi:hypothetical protein
MGNNYGVFNNNRQVFARSVFECIRIPDQLSGISQGKLYVPRDIWNTVIHRRCHAFISMTMKLEPTRRQPTAMPPIPLASVRTRAIGFILVVLFMILYMSLWHRLDVQNHFALVSLITVCGTYPDLLYRIVLDLKPEFLDRMRDDQRQTLRIFQKILEYKTKRAYKLASQRGDRDC